MLQASQHLSVAASASPVAGVGGSATGPAATPTGVADVTPPAAKRQCVQPGANSTQVQQLGAEEQHL